MKIEKVNMELNKFFYSDDDDPVLDQGKEIMEQVDEKVIEEFILGITPCLNAHAHSSLKDKVIKDVSYSQVYADPATDMASIAVDFTTNYNIQFSCALNAVDCLMDSDLDGNFTSALTKVWRKVLLKHFREQVTPYLKAEKARKQEEIEDEQKRLDNEFTFDDGVKI